ncbi:MAG: hypothetical protein U1E62_07430 [Alsobacter sp.]
MTVASALRGPAVLTARPRTVPAPGPGLFRRIVEAIVDSRRRKAIRDLRRHQAFGPLISIKHIGLTRDELLPF